MKATFNLSDGRIITVKVQENDLNRLYSRIANYQTARELYKIICARNEEKDVRMFQGMGGYYMIAVPLK